MTNEERDKHRMVWVRAQLARALAGSRVQPVERPFEKHEVGLPEEPGPEMAD